MFQCVDRFEDEVALLENGAEFERRVGLLDGRDLGADAVGDRDDVRVGLRRNDHRFCGHAVEPREDALLLDAVGDGGDVVEVDGRTVVDGDDGVSDFGCGFVERARTDAEFLRPNRDQARGEIDVFVRESFDDIGIGDAVARDLVLVRSDHDRTHLTAVGLHAADARHGRKLIRENVRKEIVEIALRARRIRDVVANDGRGVEVGFDDLRLLQVGIVRKRVACARDLLLDVVDGDVDVGSEFELGADRRLPLNRVRLQIVDAGDARDRILERTRDGRFDRFRRDVTVIDRDGNDGRLERRQQIDRQPREREDAEHDDRGREHRNRDATRDGKPGDRQRGLLK